MINIRRLHEKITLDYIKSIWDDALVFLKNVKRVKTSEQWIELNREWVKWIREYFFEKVNRNIFGDQTLHSFPDEDRKNIIFFRELDKFTKWAPMAFLPSSVEIKHWNTKMFNKEKSTGIIPNLPVNLSLKISNLMILEKNSLAHEYITDQEIEWMFDVFKTTVNSKYIGIKKRIDALFTLIYDRVESNNNNPDIPAYELNVQEHITIDGVKVLLEYPEYEEDFMDMMVDRVKRSFKYIKDAGFGKALHYSKNLIISSTDRAANNNNYVRDNNVGMGGYYNVQMDTVSILKGRIKTLEPLVSIEAIIHEYGHRFYYQFLHSSQRKDWEAFIESLTEKISPSLTFTEEEISNIDNNLADGNIKFRRVKDRINSEISDSNLDKNVVDWKEEYSKYPEIVEMGKSLTAFINYFSPGTLTKIYNMQKNGVDLLSEINSEIKRLQKEDISYNETGIITTMSISKITLFIRGILKRSGIRIGNVTQAPTDYATKNPSEFFAETFTAYCLWKTDFGRKVYKLSDSVFEKFIDITRVRSVTRESIQKLYFIHNTDKAPYLGTQYGQDIEPSGFYCIKKDPHVKLLPGWISGVARITCPLLLPLYIDGESWKRYLAKKYKATKKSLTNKLLRMGYDAIITTEPDREEETAEIVILDPSIIKFD